MIAAGSTLSSLSPVIGFFGAILALVGIVGAAFAYFKAAYARGTIETLKDSNAALIEKVDILEGASVECTTRLQAVEAENATLRTVVSGSDAIHTLARQIADQHAEVMARVTEVFETIAAHVAITEHAITHRAPAKKTAARKTTTRRSGR